MGCMIDPPFNFSARMSAMFPDEYQGQALRVLEEISTLRFAFGSYFFKKPCLSVNMTGKAA